MVNRLKHRRPVHTRAGDTTSQQSAAFSTKPRAAHVPAQPVRRFQRAVGNLAFARFTQNARNVEPVETAGGPRVDEMPGSAAQRSPIQGHVATPPQAPVVQRQPAQPAAPAEITAQDVFPFQQGNRLLLGNIMEEFFFRVLSGREPATGLALQAIHGKVATVTVASPDLFEAQITDPVTIPAQGDQPARTLRSITVRLRRSGGAFDFSLLAREGDRADLTALTAFTGLTAQREGGRIVLSAGSGQTRQPQLRVSSREGGVSRLEVFTAAVAGEQLPLIPETIEVIELARLPEAATAAQVQAATAAIASRQRGRRTRRQEINVGAGAQFGDARAAALFSASWQIRFPTTRLLSPFGLDPAVQAAVGQSLQIPVEVQLQYAPSASILAGISSGITARLPSAIPVNLRLVTGVAGGRLDVPAGAGSEGRGAFGPTLGGAAGVELGRWRVNLRYEHLFNIVENSPGVDSVFATGGIAF